MNLHEVYKNSGLGKWFHGESANKTPGWERYNSKGEVAGECGDAKKGDSYSACLSKQKASKLGKKGIANFVKRKRAAQSSAGRSKKGSSKKGKKPINVDTGASKMEESTNLNKIKQLIKENIIFNFMENAKFARRGAEKQRPKSWSKGTKSGSDKRKMREEGKRQSDPRENY